MTSSSERVAPKSPHARFIPREEVQSFEAWKPGALGGGAPQAGAAAARPAADPETARAALKMARDQGYHDGYRDGLAALDAFRQSFAAQVTSQVGALLA